MTQVSDFSAVSTIWLWCWQSLHVHCGNGQGPVSVLELSGGISDILSIFGEHLTVRGGNERFILLGVFSFLFFFLLNCVLQAASVLQALIAFVQLLF